MAAGEVGGAAALRAVSGSATRTPSLREWNVAFTAAEDRRAVSRDAAALADAVVNAAASALDDFQRRGVPISDAISVPVASLRRAARDAATALAVATAVAV